MLGAIPNGSLKPIVGFITACYSSRRISISSHLTEAASGAAKIDTITAPRPILGRVWFFAKVDVMMSGARHAPWHRRV